MISAILLAFASLQNELPINSIPRQVNNDNNNIITNTQTNKQTNKHTHTPHTKTHKNELGYLHHFITGCNQLT